MTVDANRLLSLFGRRSDDPDVESTLVELRTRRRPELDPQDRECWTTGKLVRRRGVELGFVDRAFFMALESGNVVGIPQTWSFFSCTSTRRSKMWRSSRTGCHSVSNGPTTGRKFGGSFGNMNGFFAHIGETHGSCPDSG